MPHSKAEHSSCCVVRKSEWLAGDCCIIIGTYDVYAISQEQCKSLLKIENCQIGEKNNEKGFTFCV